MEIVIVNEELCECGHLVVEHEELEGPCKAAACECEAMEPVQATVRDTRADMAP
jgi:hypothetical protein